MANQQDTKLLAVFSDDSIGLLLVRGEAEIGIHQMPALIASYQKPAQLVRRLAEGCERRPARKARGRCDLLAGRRDTVFPTSSEIADWFLAADKTG
jgi:hypothetical protein